MVKVVVDIMGGDFGPKPIIEGVVHALKEAEFEAILVGDEQIARELLPKKFHNKVSFINSTDYIKMDENATDALKRKESSIYKAIELVRNKEADAVVSAGHSGATMSLATLRIGRIKGIKRPAIATFMPTIKKTHTLVLDVGANVDSDSENLYQFGLMGEIYSREVLHHTNPKIGLLSNGEEDSKGNSVTKETFLKFKSTPSFVGNVEGNDIFKGEVDVVVCDGFVGNILLKTSEGVADTIVTLIKEEVRKSGLISKVGALLMRRVFKVLKKSIDYAEYGGAPLLGVNGCVIISHGKSNAKAIKNAIFQAINYTNADITAKIETKLKG
jgi:glycerol-3-phosphate acyltransferase PlsX